jgi:hypothetical protein
MGKNGERSHLAFPPRATFALPVFTQVLDQVDDAYARQVAALSDGARPEELESHSMRPEQRTRGKRDSRAAWLEELTRLIHGEAGLAAAGARDIFFVSEITDLDDVQSGRDFAMCRAKSFQSAGSRWFRAEHLSMPWLKVGHGRYQERRRRTASCRGEMLT